MKKITAFVFFLVLLGAGCQRSETSVTPSSISAMPAGWVSYEDPAGKYSFAHPKETFVSLSKDKQTITLLPSSPEDSPVPDMTITLKDGDVEFKAWENFEIPYFNELVSSFRFK